MEELLAHLSGTRTWAAYQHYGSPFLRFFESWTLQEPEPQKPARAPSAPKRRKRSRRR